MKGCLIAVLVVVVVGILVAVIGGYWVYSNKDEIMKSVENSVKDMMTLPEYAKKEMVYKKYEDLLASVDACVEKSDSATALVDELKKIELPAELVYMAVEKEGDSDKENKIEVVKKYSGSGSHNYKIINGSGCGTAGGKDVLIIQYGIEKLDDVKNCLVYLAYDKKAAEAALKEKSAPAAEDAPAEETAEEPAPETADTATE